MADETDIEGAVGPIDDVALEEIRTVFTRADGLVEDAGFDSHLDPTKLQIHFRDGIAEATWCRFDIRWFQRQYYSFHYLDECGVQFRYDYHPKPDAPAKHFHTPPDANSDDVEQSCIVTTEPMLVARAVHQLWRRAYETASFGALNTAENPP
ncbi:uncharacterized protein HfgLR_03000 [Haloferax gibbonsii]|uniref:Uncharacterized protein n=1 Tax=Haloferax gibbonsii TaxID=35746 RepID=A0A871BCB6_HALGI|nr:hypothetical protein [Haloferax gibbonsii]QOS10747.1 uncharacterized protein HfgLR_03000 [Haloferax gibbonsii]